MALEPPSPRHLLRGDLMARFRMSPPGAALNLALVFAVVLFWYWRRKKKARASKRGTSPLTEDLSPSVDSTKFTDRGEDAEQSAFRTGDGVYSHGEFAAGEVLTRSDASQM
jgi:cbb3-type cytochrome oxidase subunit 3